MSTEASRTGAPRGAEGRPRMGLILMENGDQLRAIHQPMAFPTIEAAKAYKAQLPPDSPADVEMGRRIYEAENKIHGPVQESALGYGDVAMQNLNEAVETTDAQTAAVTDAIAKLKGGTMSTADAVKLMEQVIRSQQYMDKTVDAKRAGTVQALAHYADPIKHHDELVRRMPIIGRRRPAVSF